MMIDHALELARAGWRVFPVWHVKPDGACACGRPPPCQVGKHPRCTHGHNDATTDEAKIRRWWSAERINTLAPGAWECCPDSNVGIAVPEGVVIVDVDPRNGGDATFNALPGGAWTETLYVLSGGGGLQLYLSCEPGRRFPKTLDAHFGPGIDLKQCGGYVQAAGNNHKSGGTYEWGNPGARILPAPPWLLGLQKEQATDVPALPPPVDVALDAQQRALLDRAIAIIEPEYVYGRRHNLALAIGGYIRNAGRPWSFAHYIISQLPSTNPEARIRAARGAFTLKGRPLGAQGIRDIEPELLTQLDALGFKPTRRQAREQREAEQTENWIDGTLATKRRWEAEAAARLARVQDGQRQ